MIDEPAKNRPSKRQSHEQKKRKKLNTLVDTLMRNLEPRRISIQVERCDADADKRNRKSRSPDKSPRIARKPCEGDDSESEPLSHLLSRGAKLSEAKGALSPSPSSDVTGSKFVKKDAKKDTVKSGKMPNKMDEKKAESVKKEEVIKKAQKEDLKVKSADKLVKSDDAKKVGESNAKSVVKHAKGKPVKVDGSDNREVVSVDSVDQEKDSGTKSPVLAKPAPVQQKSSIKKLLENTIRNRLKRTKDENDEGVSPPKKRKVGRPPKARSDSPKPLKQKVKKLVQNVESGLKDDVTPKKRGRKKKALAGPQESSEEVTEQSEAVTKESQQKVKESTSDCDEKQGIKKVKFAIKESDNSDESLHGGKAKEKKTKVESDKKAKAKHLKEEETDSSDVEVEKVKKSKGKKNEEKADSENEASKKTKKHVAKEEKADGTDNDGEKVKKVKNKKQEEKTDASDSEHEKLKRTVKGKKEKVADSSDSEDEEKSVTKTNKKTKKKTEKAESSESEGESKLKTTKRTIKKKIDKAESSDSDSEEKPKASKKTTKKKNEKLESSDSESEGKRKLPKKVTKKKSEKAESSDSESEEKQKTKKSAKKKEKSESDASDTGQKPKKVKVAKKVVKMRARFRRKRVASLNARAKVTCMVDEDEDPIDFNHYITMFPVVVGDDVILRKKKKKGVFMRRPRKQRQPEAPQLEMKDLIVPKRMASLNATAMMAASTDFDRRKKDEDGIKSPTMRKEEEDESAKKEETSEKEKKTKKNEEQSKKGARKVEEPPKPDIDVYEFQCDDKPVKTPKKKCDVEKKNKDIPLKKRKRVEPKESPVASPVASSESKEEKTTPVKLPEPVSETKEACDEQHQTQQGVLDLRSPQSLAIPSAVDALLKNSDAVTISGVYIDARCSSQSSSHSYVISGSMQAYNYSVATRTDERRTVTPPPVQPTVAKVRPYNPLGALCGMRIPDQTQTQGQAPSDHHWRPHDSKPPSSQPGEHSHSSAFQAPAHQPPPPGWYQPAGPLIHTPYKPPERQSPEPSTSRPISPPQEKKEEPSASPEKSRTPPPEWHSAPPERAFHHYYPHYPPAPYPFYHYPPLPPSSSTQSRDGYSGYPGPPLPHPHPVYPYQGTSYYPPPPPPSHQGYPAYDPYDPYRQSTSSLVPPPNGSPGSNYPVRPAPHLVRPTVLPAPTPYYPPYYGCHQQTAPAPPAHYDPRHMRCSCPSRSPTCPKNVQPGPLTGEGVGPGYLVENPHTPLAPGPRALASPASGSIPRNMESQTPGSGAKVVDSETAPVTKKYLSAKEMKKLLKSIDLETCRKVWKQKKAERKRQKVEKRKMSLLSEYSSADDFQDNIPLKYLAKEIKLEKLDEFDSELTNSSSCDSNLLQVKTECIKVEDDRRTPPVNLFEEPVKEQDEPEKQADPLPCDEPEQVEKLQKPENPLVVRRKRRKKRNLQPKKVLEPRIKKKRGRKPKIAPPTNGLPVKRTSSVNGRSSGARGPSRLNSVTPTEVRAPSRVEEKAASAQERKEKPSCGWSWYGEPYEAKVYLSNDDPPVLRRCYPSMRHEEGEIIRVRDSVILRSGTRANDLPYVAKVAAMWDNPDDGEMMISILWFYRPEHTDRGRKFGDRCDEVFASRHRDITYVACIEDKCHVLTYNEYCRYRAMTTRIDEGNWPPPTAPVVPPLPKDSIEGLNSHLSRVDRIPTIKMGADRVFLCRKVYDYRQKRILKNPA